MRRLCLTLVAIACCTVGPVAANPLTIWTSPLDAAEGWRGISTSPLLTIEQSSPAAAVVVTTSVPEVASWIQIPVTVPDDFLLGGVTVCYQVSNASSSIGLLRVTEIRTPDFGVARHSAVVNLTSTSATCHTTDVNATCGPCIPFTPGGALTVDLSLNFADAGHSIEIGGVALHGTWLTVDAPDSGIPATVTLAQNVPNPFREDTRIEYTLAHAGEVRIRIFDVAGRRLQSFDLGVMPAGTHTLQWNGVDENGVAAAPGTYFYQAQLAGEVVTRRMTIRR